MPDVCINPLSTETGDTVKYLPFEQRTPDNQYHRMLTTIYCHGETIMPRQGVEALTVMQQTMKFPLSNGFPVITERSMARFWQKPIGELCAFINGVTRADELRDFGADWWEPWTTPQKTASRGLEPGDLGPGSYGGAFHHFPTADGPFDQFKHLVEQIRELPNLRTHYVSPWIPQHQVRGQGKQARTTISPCHGWVHVRVLAGRLHLHMMQRSGDVPVGVPSNMVQYAALLLMLEHLTGYEAATYYHTISDAHIYADQLDKVEIMLSREPRVLPTVHLNEAGRQVTDIHDFRREHFDLTDYLPHGGLSVPVST